MTSMTDPPVIYSIGHGHRDLAAFIALLRHHHVTTLVDVRSQPYSHWAPDFNRERLARVLAEAGLTYVFMGDRLGGRPSNPSLYDSGLTESPPNYDLVAKTPGFRAGVEQLLELARSSRVAMMCSEGDHRGCHRALLITPSLLRLGARVIHIRPDDETVEAQPEPKQLTLF